jgi:3D (Asp-Asp-Asp) domain-containing protein
MAQRQALARLLLQKRYPFGTKMYVPGYGCGSVEDRGGEIKGRHIDVWFSSEAAAREFGARRRVAVEVCDDPSR